MTNTFKLKKGLGRGLSSLIGDNSSQAKSNKVSISQIVRNKFQPRKNFDKENMKEKEVDAIEGASDKKTELQATANQKYKQALNVANQAAMESSDELQLIKAERVRRLIEANKTNPAAIDRILADEFGILVMNPKDKS